MTEHVHKLGQGFNIAYMEEYVWCIECKQKWSKIEVTRRLNATDRLSADAAEYAAEFTQAGTNEHSMDQESEGNIYYLTDALRAYAAAREDAPR